MGNPDWSRTLDEVANTVRGCLAALDRYEAKFAEVFAEAAPSSPRALPEGNADGWEERLAAARGQAEEVERLLAEQEAVWGRWQTALAAWRRSVEQPPP